MHPFPVVLSIECWGEARTETSRLYQVLPTLKPLLSFLPWRYISEWAGMAVSPHLFMSHFDVYSKWQVKGYQAQEACYFFFVQDRKPSYILSRLLRTTFWTKLADFPLKLENNSNIIDGNQKREWAESFPKAKLGKCTTYDHTTPN